MKLKYLLLPFVAISLLLSSCEDDQKISSLAEIKASMSYIGFGPAAGSQTITLSTTDSWNITNIPEWLTVSPSSGSAAPAGTSVTFSVAETDSDNAAELKVICGDKTQFLTVKQVCGPTEVVISTCQFVNESGVDGKIYWVEGAITSIVNTTYGNMYINDGTGTVYVYGTLDAYGAEKNFLSLGLAVGDRVMVHGPRTNYNGTIELVNVTVDKVTPSLIKAATDKVELSKEGGEFEVAVAYKGNGITIDYDVDWLSVKSMNKGSDDTTRVVFAAQPNNMGARQGNISMTSATSSASSTIQVAVVQQGSIQDATIAEFLAAPVDANALYRLSGVIVSIVSDTYGNFTIKDASGEVYVYGLLTEKGGASKQFATLGLKVGDICTLVGVRAAYKETAQVGSAYHESHITVTPISVEDFLKTPVDANVWYSLTGKVSNVVNTTYGNFDLVDETGTVYVYGLLTGYKGVNKQYASLNIVEGDTLTLHGVHAAYKDADQVGSAYYISHTPAAE